MYTTNSGSRIKETCKILFGLSDDQLYGNLQNNIDNRWNVTPSQICDFIGKNFLEKQTHKLVSFIEESDWKIYLNEKIQIHHTIEIEEYNPKHISSYKFPQVIGITGKKYNGKDTVSNYLTPKYGYYRIAYADPMKEACRIIFGFNEDQLYGTSKEIVDNRWNISPRQAFQYIGTDLFRKQIYLLIPELKDNFWVKCMMETIKKQLIMCPNKKYVVSDIRFQNEINSLKEEFINCKIIRVTRPSINLYNKDTDLHESEMMIDKLGMVDYDILNDSDLLSLHLKIDKIFENML